MKAIRLTLAAASLSAAPISASASSPVTCPLANIESQRELHGILNRQAVQIVQLVLDGEQERSARLINSSAPFSLGAGDVGRPLGVGVQGAKALAAAMHADTYRYLGWDYMDGPANPCSSHKVTVEFVNSRDKTVSQVDFTFDGGLLKEARGWSRSFESGALTTTDSARDKPILGWENLPPICRSSPPENSDFYDDWLKAREKSDCDGRIERLTEPTSHST